MLETALSHFNNMLLRAGRFTNIILVGDFNFDLLNPDSGVKDGRALIDLAEVYRLSNLIKEPTRVTNTSTTLIDVIFTSKPRSFLSSGVYDIGISDHCLVYAVMRSHCPKPCMKTKTKRSFKHFDQDIFSRDVSQIPFHFAYVFEDIVDVAWAWGKMFADLLEVHAPVKPVDQV